MRKALAIAVAAVMLLVAGCKTSGQPTIHVIDNPSQEQVGSGFNEETYVWESFIFTTNRVEKVN